jgi:transcriptional regulator with XRE-family HTH domain
MLAPEYQHLQHVLAANVRHWRKVRGLTQESLAQKSEIAPRHLQKLEAGELNVTLHTLYRVALALNVNVGDLFISPAEDHCD